MLQDTLRSHRATRMSHFKADTPTVRHLHEEIIRLLLDMNTIHTNVLDGLFCVTAVNSLICNGRVTHTAIGMFMICGCKFMNSSPPQPGRKSWPVQRAPNSNIHRLQRNDFYSVLLNEPFTSHKSSALSVFILFFFLS